MLAQVKSGGPLISLETTEKKDCLAIVWMSIATAQMDVDGYFVHINGQLCGNKANIKAVVLVKSTDNTDKIVLMLH